MAESYAFRVRLEQVAPVTDPSFAPAPGDVKRALLRAVVGWVLALKDAELARGLDKDGTPMAPLSRLTVERRHSAMGPADPNAPPLTPAHGLSRTRSLLDGRAHPDHALFFWRFDEHTGGPWGRILGYHRAGAGRLPVRDVIGVSPAILAECRSRARAWWHSYRTTGRVPDLEPRAAPTPPAVPPPFTVTTVPAYKPVNPAAAVPESPHRVSQLGVNGHVYTFGISADGRSSSATAASLRRGIANGTFSGFREWKEGEAEARIAASLARYKAAAAAKKGGTATGGTTVKITVKAERATTPLPVGPPGPGWDEK